MKTMPILLTCLILGLQCTTQVTAQRSRGLIAFASNRHLNADRQVLYQIFVMDPNGENRVRLTDDPARADNPAWSPNGRKIAFTSARHGKDDIYFINVDTDVRGEVLKETIIVEPPNAEAQVQDVAATLDDGLPRLTNTPHMTILRRGLPTANRLRSCLGEMATAKFTLWKPMEVINAT